MNDMVCELGQHAECDDSETDDEDNECDVDDLPVASTDSGWVRNVVDGYYVLQMAQIVEQVLHTHVAPARITTDRTHDHRG